MMGRGLNIVKRSMCAVAALALPVLVPADAGARIAAGRRIVDRTAVAAPRFDAAGPFRTPPPGFGSGGAQGTAGSAPTVAARDSVVAVKPGTRTYLEPNAPNPFSGTTTIRYSLAEETHVLLTINDGRYDQVATLVDETQPAGRYVITFAANGLGISSGVYFYTLTTSNGFEWGRMIYIE